jgi:hypothetical protein
VGDVLSIQDAASKQMRGDRCLVDETTAIVRFILPCGRPLHGRHFLAPEESESCPDGHPGPDDGAAKEARALRWFFGLLFVRSIVQVVNGEAQIWMMESGMRSRLHIWKVED